MVRYFSVTRAKAGIRAAAFSAALLIASEVDASAWTRARGQYLFVIPVEYSDARKQFDVNGEKVDRLRFQQVQIGPYLEYGLTDSFTIGAQPNYRWVRQEIALGEDAHNSGLADVNVFARYRLWSKDAAAFSVQALVKAPIEADETEAAPLGFDQADVEGSLLYGNSHETTSGRIFYNLDIGYRKRFKSPSDEMHGSGYIGWSPRGDRWSFVLASSNTFGLSNEKDKLFEALTARPDYRRNQAQLSASFRLSETASIVGGGFTTFSGREVGVAHGAFISLVFSFDPSMIFGIDPNF
jgi:hypothetical protein